jgi:hypothetical protein
MKPYVPSTLHEIPERASQELYRHTTPNAAIDIAKSHGIIDGRPVVTHSASEIQPYVCPTSTKL